MSSFLPCGAPRGECGHTLFLFRAQTADAAACSAKCIIKPTLQLYFYFSPETFEAEHLWVPVLERIDYTCEEKKEKSGRTRGPLGE